MLIAREISSDSSALRTVLTFVASLSARRPATFGYVPTKKRGASDAFCKPSISQVGLAKSIHKLPPVTYADSCTLVRYDND
eukprot:2684453-Pyramimonas_sp.AAC.1